MRHFYKTLCLTGIALLYCPIVTEAQQQGQGGYYMMICRGANSAFRIDGLERGSRYGKFGLKFLPSSTAPRGDYKKINPGTCSWDDRTVNDKEPPVIVLTAGDYQWKRITDALSTREQLWMFYVRLDKMKNSAGEQLFFKTRNHRALPPLK